jgi:hypothetical protein
MGAIFLYEVIIVINILLHLHYPLDFLSPVFLSLNPPAPCITLTLPAQETFKSQPSASVSPFAFTPPHIKTPLPSKHESAPKKPLGPG